MVTLHIKVKKNHECSKIVANILPTDPTHPICPTLWLGSKGKKSTFSEHGHGAYQIKRNTNEQHGSNYFAGRPPPDPTPTLGME